jgi:biotin-dependent carboxylase-like uncharacterized protein
MSSIEVIHPGMLSSVQDLGRQGYQHMGVPLSGAFDRDSLLVGNMLLGNNDDDAAIEMTLIGGVFRFLCASRVCLTGSEARNATISLDARVHPIPHQRAFDVSRGSVLEIGPLRRGARLYLCVSGGIRTPEVLTSRSALVSLPDAGLGKPLCAGEHVPILETSDSGRQGVCLMTRQSSPDVIRVVESHHTELFTEDHIQQLCSVPFRVSSQSNRAGVRLESSMLKGKLPSIEQSVGTLPGYIQVPSSGAPIVLGVDGPTTGGYPVIACVIERDLPKLAQASPNDYLRFEWVTREELDA